MKILYVDLPMQYTIRQAVANDLDFLDRIHAENMKGYVEKVYPWQPCLFRHSYIPEDYQVIEVNHKIAGFIKVVFSEKEIYLAEIQIAQDFQKKGIGSSLIQSVIKEAEISNKKLWLKVLKGNPAKEIYERLGFRKTQESSTHEIMSKECQKGCK